jgi:ribosomal protein L37AE/L43A
MKRVLSVPEIQARYVDKEKMGGDYTVDFNRYDMFGNYVEDNVPEITHEDLIVFDSMNIKDASKIIFDLLVASDNQNATVLITGPPGSGKDYLSNTLSYNLAIRLANYRWQDVRLWRDAYPYWRNTAIIHQADIIKVMEGNGELEVRRLDDVFRAMDRAEYYTKEHQYMNTLQSVNRTENSCTIMSAQYSKMIDGIIRNLCRFWIRCFRNVDWRGKGYNEFVMYIFDKNEMDSKSVPYNKSIRDIVNKRRQVHDRGANQIPPAELIDWYLPRRKAAVEELKVIRKTNKEKEAVEEENEAKEDSAESYIPACPTCFKRGSVRWRKKTNEWVCGKCGTGFMGSKKNPLT